MFIVYMVKEFIIKMQVLLYNSDTHYIVQTKYHSLQIDFIHFNPVNIIV